jgi:hypothetical protein
VPDTDRNCSYNLVEAPWAVRQSQFALIIPNSSQRHIVAEAKTNKQLNQRAAASGPGFVSLKVCPSF